MPSSSSSLGGRDFIADFDNTRSTDEWAYSIISAMGKIQKQYAIEQGLDEPLPKEYFTDEDRVRFFLSGFSNSNNRKHFIDVILAPFIHWELIFILVIATFFKIYLLSTIENHGASIAMMFLIGYGTIITYSIYLSQKWRYFVYGDIASKMFLWLILGRFIYLICIGITISYLLISAINYLLQNPKMLLEYSYRIYWLIDFFGVSLGSKKEFAIAMYREILPTLKQETRNMLLTCALLGIAPLVSAGISKIILDYKYHQQKKKYEEG